MLKRNINTVKGATAIKGACELFLGECSLNGQLFNILFYVQYSVLGPCLIYYILHKLFSKDGINL